MNNTFQRLRLWPVVFSLVALAAANPMVASGAPLNEPSEPQSGPATARFQLRYPNYRGWLFPGHRSAEVGIAIPPDTFRFRAPGLELRLELSGTGLTNRAAHRLQSETAELSVPAEGLPAGDLLLKASLCSGSRQLAARTWHLRLLTRAEVKSVRAYVDSDNRLILDGKPFFPLGWYGAVNESQLAEIADSPFNCLLAYGTDRVPKERMRRFLDTMQASGLKLIYCMNDVYPTATYLKNTGWEGIRGNSNIAAAVVEAYRDHPAILAWYLNDELPRKLAPQLEGYYHAVRQGDPSRPCFIVLCNTSEFRYFPQTTDILGVDPYPIPRHPVTQVADYLDAAQKAVQGAEPVWLVPQAFAWYQYNSKNADRGHIPSKEELRTGRAPTREEERCMTYLGLIHGAKGLIYYCYYDLRVLPQYKEMWGWMKSIAAEVKTLSPALLSTQAPGHWRVSTPVQGRLFRKGDRLYLLAANPTKAPCQVRFDLERTIGRQVEVLFENRDIPANDGTFQDSFTPLAVHVYLVRWPSAAPGSTRN